MKFNIGEVELEFDEQTHELKLDDKKIIPAIRTFADMKDMYSDYDKIEDKHWLYFMFRWVYLNKDDKTLFEKNNMRYDVTVILPEIIWKELNKTYWHYHPSKIDGKKFEEIYEVLSWSAIYLQQNDNEVKFTDAFAWDKVVMDESFWHITINPSDEEVLVMANIVNDSFESEYWNYKEFKWGNYYYTVKWFEKNPNYKNDLEIKESEELFEWWDMYEQFLDDPEKFNFLN